MSKSHHTNLLKRNINITVRWYRQLLNWKHCSLQRNSFASIRDGATFSYIIWVHYGVLTNVCVIYVDIVKHNIYLCSKLVEKIIKNWFDFFLIFTNKPIVSVGFNISLKSYIMQNNSLKVMKLLLLKNKNIKKKLLSKSEFVPEGFGLVHVLML